MDMISKQRHNIFLGMDRSFSEGEIYDSESEEVSLQTPNNRKKPKKIPPSTKFWLEESDSYIGMLGQIKDDDSVGERKQNQNSQNQNQEQPQSLVIPKKLVMMKRKLDKQNKNTPRFLVRLAIKYLKSYKDQYPPEIYQIMKKACEDLEKWHLEQKSHVYLINHLKYIFSDRETFTEEGTRLNRRFFREILMKYASQEMDQPKSQVKHNKVDYFRACKVFSLRCMSEDLVMRNQTK